MKSNKTILRLNIYSLFITLTLSGQTTWGNPVPNPPPVNCMYTRWTDYTACDPCTHERRRSRGIEAFGQFNGAACSGSLGERGPCNAAGPCVKPALPNCTASQFRCDIGRCINKRLECNWDLDCQDQSDETCETEPRKPCRDPDLEVNVHGRAAGYGMNLLGSAPFQNPFFNEYFNGICTQSWDPTQKKQIRLPWNVPVLHYETNVEETVSTELFENKDTLIKEVMTETSWSVDGELSFQFKGVSSGTGGSAGAGGSADAGGSAGPGGSVSIGGGYETSDMVTNVLSKTNTRTKKYVRVKGSIQFASFRMRLRDPRVVDSFIVEVMHLPVQYEKSFYFDFLGLFGTHYNSNGKLGGQYQLVYEVDSETLEHSDMTESEVKECFNVNVNVQVDQFSAGVKPKKCTTKKEKEGEGPSSKQALVSDVFSSVKGGSAEAAAAMRVSIELDGKISAEAYAEWAKSVVEQPAVIHNEPELIYTLVPPELPDADTRVANLKRAIEEYVAEFSVCKCRPCNNGGTVMLMDGKCECLCEPLYDGLACQNYKADKLPSAGSRPLVPQVGNWACWAQWSSCQANGYRVRRRTCNTVGLVGANCRGSETAQEQC